MTFPSLARTVFAVLPLSHCPAFTRSSSKSMNRYPTEVTVAGMLPDDGVLDRGELRLSREGNPPRTLIMASCDPAAGLIASECLLPLHRSSREALQLLRHGLVHVAGIHLSAAENRSGNARAAREILGNGFSLLRFATWDEGLAVHPSTSCSSVNAVVRANLRWVGREPGAGAPQCQDEIFHQDELVLIASASHRQVRSSCTEPNQSELKGPFVLRPSTTWLPTASRTA
jgi:hypothetical protein